MCGTLLQELQELGSHCKFNAYADDLILLVKGQSRAELERRDTKLVQIVVEWSKKVGVQVSLDKTVMLLLRGRLSLMRPPNVRCADKDKSNKKAVITTDQTNKGIRSKVISVDRHAFTAVTISNRTTHYR